MNVYELEKNLEKLTGLINDNYDKEYIETSISHLFSSINLKSEDLNIEFVDITEGVAAAWTFFEKLFIHNKDAEKVREVYDYIIDGFFNFWKSPKYFNQELISDSKEKGTCFVSGLDEKFVNTYIVTSTLVYVNDVMGLKFDDFDNFESDLIKESLNTYFFMKCDRTRNIRIIINDLEYGKYE